MLSQEAAYNGSAAAKSQAMGSQVQKRSAGFRIVRRQGARASSPPVHCDLDAVLGGERDGVAQGQRLLAWGQPESVGSENVVQRNLGLLDGKAPAWAPPRPIACAEGRVQQSIGAETVCVLFTT